VKALYSDVTVVWQLGEFREPRAGEGLRRIVRFYSLTAEWTLTVLLFEARFSYEEARLDVDRFRVSFDGAGVVRYVGRVPAEGGWWVSLNPPGVQRQVLATANRGQVFDCAPTVPTPSPSEPSSHRGEALAGRVLTGLGWCEIG